MKMLIRKTYWLELLSTGKMWIMWTHHFEGAEYLFKNEKKKMYRRFLLLLTLYLKPLLIERLRTLHNFWVFWRTPEAENLSQNNTKIGDFKKRIFQKCFFLVIALIKWDLQYKWWRKNWIKNCKNILSERSEWKIRYVSASWLEVSS